MIRILATILAFGVGYLNTLFWEWSWQTILADYPLEFISNAKEEGLWVGGIFALGMLLVFLWQNWRAEIQSKHIYIFSFFGLLGANLAIVAQMSGVAWKVLPKLLANNSNAVLDMKDYSYINWGGFGLFSGLFLTALLLFFIGLLKEE